MEGIKAFHTEVIEETRSKAEMITFVSMAEIEHARKELCEAGIQESRFSDGELIRTDRISIFESIRRS